ncbi:MAG TPA: DinB family protein [Candidatus Angelobacter sp.]|nr:DinB family protein [Candidatus Angelobacter sp.]
METPLQYKARILALMEGKDPVTVQRETYGQLAELVGGASDEKLRTRPAPDRWSVAEVLAHLSEAEVVSTWRYRQMIEHEGCTLPGYGQELWAELGQYASRSPKDSLAQFRVLRDSNLRMFDGLTEAQWQRKGVHAERGPMTVHDLAVQIAGHDINHLAQIKAILK